MAATKVRLRFAKQSDLRLVSHHDLMRCCERAVRRAQLPIAQTQGFSPRPRIVFALAMAVGIEGRREVMDLVLDAEIPAAEVGRRFSNALPPGFVIHEAFAVPLKASCQAIAAHYSLSVPSERLAQSQTELRQFHASINWPYERVRPDRTTQFDLRPHVRGATLDATGRLEFTLTIDNLGSARPEEFLEALALADLLESGAILTRENIELAFESEAEQHKPGEHSILC
jgi:radical SAM-linked protein